jgi:phospholipid/cholesterol/gamma-HCH transport system substrate-binding protein
MANSLDASVSTKLKVGIFTVAGLALVGLMTVLVNQKPFWWRPCQLVHIDIDDATGLKMKSPVQSMGIEIGYIKNIHLTETHVDLGICITAPVEVLPATRAFIRAEGFLGDKFVELKPVRYTGSNEARRSKPSQTLGRSFESSFVRALDALVENEALAADESVPVAAPTTSIQSNPADTSSAVVTKSGKKSERQIPVGEESRDMQAVMNKVDGLVTELTQLTSNLKQALNPEELRYTMKQLNKTLENASKTLSPEGGINQTAQRALSKLEDSVEQLRTMLTRINQGQGSVGMILNDPVYAEQLKELLQKANKLLGHVDDLRFVIDIGAQKIRGYQSDRGFFELKIYPNPTRYYLLGIALDPRGRRTITDTTTTAAGQTSVTQTTQVEETGILLTAMVGKLFLDRRLDLAVGVLYGDGAVTVAGNLGPSGMEERLRLESQVYSRGIGYPTDMRINLIVRPYSGLYVQGGVEGFHSVNSLIPWSYGAGVTFDDEDIKLLFALR